LNAIIILELAASEHITGRVWHSRNSSIRKSELVCSASWGTLLAEGPPVRRNAKSNYVASENENSKLALTAQITLARLWEFSGARTVGSTNNAKRLEFIKQNGYRTFLESANT
jgi:hypothetical protein